MARSGYPSAPSIVYWILRALRGVPVDEHEEGVVMLSRFSSSLLEAFLAGNMEQFSPKAPMLEVLKWIAILDDPIYLGKIPVGSKKN
jgi:hypothetical protein